MRCTPNTRLKKTHARVFFHSFLRCVLWLNDTSYSKSVWTDNLWTCLLVTRYATFSPVHQPREPQITIYSVTDGQTVEQTTELITPIADLILCISTIGWNGDWRTYNFYNKTSELNAVIWFMIYDLWLYSYFLVLISAFGVFRCVLSTFHIRIYGWI